MKTLKFLSVLLLLQVPFLLQAQVRGTGAKFDLNSYRKAETADFSGLGFTTTLPSKVSHKQFAPQAKDQGQMSTCVGWSTTYGALTIQYAKMTGLKDRNRITAKAFCPYFTFNQIRQPNDMACQSGTYLYNALTSLRTGGAKRFFLPVYDCSTQIEEEAFFYSKPFRIKSFKKLFDYPYETQQWSPEAFYKLNIDKVTPVKQALANGYAVPFGMEFPESGFYVIGKDLWEPTAAELAQIPNLQTYGHAMVVVGYDDAKYGGAFEIMNSWSENWGDKGFFWMKYNDFKKFVVDAYYFDIFEEAATKKGCVSGDCQNLYSRMIFDSGDEFEGNFKNGKYDGYGIYTWADGLVYAGQWKEGKRHGLGTSITSLGVSYTQNWASDAPSATAVTSDKTTKTGCTSGNCADGFGTYQYTNGSYTGTFSGNKRNGWGTYTYKDGTKVAATWLLDQISGFGKLSYNDGWHYVGEFLFDMQNGIGLEYGIDGFMAAEWFLGSPLTGDGLGFSGKAALTESNAEISKLRPAAGTATGCTSGNCKDGNGTMKYANGETYIGYFKGGFRDGFGTYTWSNGTKYEGVWLADKMDGVGKIYFANGSYFIGEFRKGLQDGYGLEVTKTNYIAGVWEFGKYVPGKATLGFAELKDKKKNKDFDLSKIIDNSPETDKIIKSVAERTVTQ